MRNTNTGLASNFKSFIIAQNTTHKMKTNNAMKKATRRRPQVVECSDLFI
jgi:hypothetical protein